MKKRWISLVMAGCVLVGLLVAYATWESVPSTLRLGEGDFTLRVARTEQELNRGLSGTTNLPADQALLFVFARSETWGIWMKDMNYPIDIVWLDEDKTVVSTKKNAQPSSYPDEIFRPSERAKYVIELKAGTVDDKRITIGEQAVFDSTKGSFE